MMSGARRKKSSARVLSFTASSGRKSLTPKQRRRVSHKGGGMFKIGAATGTGTRRTGHVVKRQPRMKGRR